MIDFERFIKLLNEKIKGIDREESIISAIFGSISAVVRGLVAV